MDHAPSVVGDLRFMRHEDDGQAAFAVQSLKDGHDLGAGARVECARRLVNHPSILLADEPTGALDTHTSYEIMGLFERLHEAGNTIIVVTHEQDIAARAHRIIHIRDGQIETDERTR